MSAAPEHHAGVVEEMLLHELGGGRAFMPRADIEIDASLLQGGLKRRIPALDQMQPNLRVARAERFERRRQQRHMRGERQPGDDLSTRAAVQLLDFIAGAPHFAEHRARPAHERLAHRGEDHAARASLEGAQAALKKNFVDAEGPDVEFARRAFDRA